MSGYVEYAEQLPWTYPDEAVDAGEVALERGAIVSGNVLDHLGQPVPGAEVDIWNARASSSALTDAMGAYVLEHAGAGGLSTLVASHGDFRDLDDSRRFIALGPGELRGGVELRLGRLKDVLVAVRDTSGRPVEGANVRASDRRCDCSEFESAAAGFDDERTDEDGLARLRVASDAIAVCIGASAPGHREVRNRCMNGEALATIVLEPLPALLVQVADARTGVPIERALVSLEAVGDPPFRSSQCSVRNIGGGDYLASYGDGGCYRVRASAHGWSPATSDVFECSAGGPGGSGASAVVKIALEPLLGIFVRIVAADTGLPLGSASFDLLEEVSLAQSRAEHVAVREVRYQSQVATPGAQRVAGVTLRCEHRTVCSLTAGADGIVRLVVPPGRYTYRIEAEGYGAAPGRSVEVAQDSGSTPWDVEAFPTGVIAGLVIPFAGAGSPGAGPRVEAGRAAGIEVLIHRRDGFRRFVRTDAEGRFRTTGLAPGRYAVEVLGPMEHELLSRTLDLTAPLEASILSPWDAPYVVAPGEQLDLVFDLRRAGTGAHAGRVTENGGVPDDLVARLVRLGEANRATSQRGEVGRDGSFGFWSLEPGAHRLEFFVPFNTVSLGAWDVVVRPGYESTQEYAVATGGILCRLRSGVPGKEVGRPSVVIDHGRGTQEIKVYEPDVDGWFRFLRLPAGPWRLGVRADGFAPLVRVVTAVAGVDVEELVLLEPAAELLVRVTWNGEPYSAWKVVVLDEAGEEVDCHQEEVEPGLVRVSGLPPGRFTVDYWAEEDTFGTPFELRCTKSIVLAAGQRSEVDLELELYDP